MASASDSTGNPTVTRRRDRAADAVWRRLAEGLSEPWLENIRSLRREGDDIDVSLDIWSVALIAELKNPDHKSHASTVLGRLRQLSDEIEHGATDE
jgi:hypothetical protein